jgi:hypothetical protein
MSARIAFNGPQSLVMRCVLPGRTIVIPWGRGVGKSWFIRRLAYLLIAQWEHRERQTPSGRVRGIRIVFLLPTFKMFRDVHSRAMLDELQNEFASLEASVDRTTFTVTFPGGSSIQVFPASDHGGQRARGIRADVAMVDEADDTDSEIYDGVVTPWFTEPWSLKIRIVSGTPKRGRHGLLFRLHEAGLKGRRIRAGRTDGFSLEELDALARFYTVHATYKHAPQNVDQREVETARVTMPAATFDREYNCNFDAGEGLVYPFDEAFHVREPPSLDFFSEFICGVDHGWTDPGVLLLGGIVGNGQDAELWLLDEQYKSEAPNSHWDALAKAWDIQAGKKVQFWADRSRPDRIDAFRHQGLAIQAGDSDPNAIAAGISRVADLLFIRQVEEIGPKFLSLVSRKARLYVSPGCTNTIREFGLYRRKKNPDGTFSEDPQDKDNHTMDALRYMVLGRFGRMPNQRTVVSGR